MGAMRRSKLERVLDAIDVSDGEGLQRRVVEGDVHHAESSPSWSAMGEALEGSSVSTARGSSVGDRAHEAL
jgi:hypothetical protein